MSQKKSIYRVRFLNQNSVCEIYARSIAESELFGFIEVEQLIFGEATSIVVDPAEEKLKTEFADVSCVYIPMHTIIRIDVVQKEGACKVIPLSSEQSKNNISTFPHITSPFGSFAQRPEPLE